MRYDSLMVTSTSYRIGNELKERLGRRARAEGITETALVSRLLEQGLVAIEHPGIVHRTGPSGWRAGLSGGPDVDEIVRTVRSTGADGDAAVVASAESLGIDSRLVRLAIDYAAAHLEEVEERIRENEAAAERVRKLDAARSSVFTG